MKFPYSVPFPSPLELVSVHLWDLCEVLHGAGKRSQRVVTDGKEETLVVVRPPTMAHLFQNRP